VSLDGKAPVLRGDVSRGGDTRGEHRACEPELGWPAKNMPCGMVDDESGQLALTLGNACPTRDGIVEALAAWWAAWDAREPGAMARLQITMANGPESRGRRTPCLHRMVACGASIGKPLPLLSSPPAHRKENPIDRWWGILAGHWNGTKGVDVETRVAWAKRMTWPGMPPMVALRRQVSHKGGDAEQAGDAGGGSPAGAPPRVALLGYAAPPDFNILTEDILFEKSP
jgi:hypothetical protein